MALDSERGVDCRYWVYNYIVLKSDDWYVYVVLCPSLSLVVVKMFWLSNFRVVSSSKLNLVGI